jgi:hypothetical protein
MLWNFDKFGIDEFGIDKFEFDKLGLHAIFYANVFLTQVNLKLKYFIKICSILL